MTGQIPTFGEGGLALFESGAIVLHIAERDESWCEKRLPVVEGRIRGRRCRLALVIPTGSTAHSAPAIS